MSSAKLWRWRSSCAKPWKLPTKWHTHQLKPDRKIDVEMCQAQRQPLNSKLPKPDKPKAKKVRKWTRLKSGLFGWKTVNVVQGLPTKCSTIKPSPHHLKVIQQILQKRIFKHFERKQISLQTGQKGKLIVRPFSFWKYKWKFRKNRTFCAENYLVLNLETRDLQN